MLPTAQPKKPRVVDKHAQAKAKLRAWQTVRKIVLKRDGGRCRVCGSRDQVDVHHIRFRSRGGKDSSENLAVLCRLCHALVHAYEVAIEGNADGTLKVTRLR